jgi:hypothetical protein
MNKRDYFYQIVIIGLLVWVSVLTFWRFQDKQITEIQKITFENYKKFSRLEYDKRLEKLEGFKECFAAEARRLNLDEGKRRLIVGLNEPYYYNYSQNDINKIVETCSNEAL